MWLVWKTSVVIQRFLQKCSTARVHDLYNDFGDLCSANVPVTELLFGDELQTQLNHIRATNKISNTTSFSHPPRRTSYGQNFNQNHVIRLIFFATSYGKETESAKPLLNLLDILTVHNVYVLHALKFTHPWHKGLLPNIFQNIFKYANTVHNYNTRYAAN